MPAKYENAIREAQRVLNENFVLRPPVDPYELATNEGLLVSEREFPTDVSNLAGYINIAEQVVVVNTLDALNRRKFTVAHELGHWILHAPALKSHPELGILNRTPLGRPDPEPRVARGQCIRGAFIGPTRYAERVSDERCRTASACFRCFRAVHDLSAQARIRF